MSRNLVRRTTCEAENCDRPAELNAFVLGSTQTEDRVLRVEHLCRECYESDEFWWEGVDADERIPAIPINRRFNA